MTKIPFSISLRGGKDFMICHEIHAYVVPILRNFVRNFKFDRILYVTTAVQMFKNNTIHVLVDDFTAQDMFVLHRSLFSVRGKCQRPVNNAGRRSR